MLSTPVLASANAFDFKAEIRDSEDTDYVLYTMRDWTLGNYYTVGVSPDERRPVFYQYDTAHGFMFEHINDSNNMNIRLDLDYISSHISLTGFMDSEDVLAAKADQSDLDTLNYFVGSLSSGLLLVSNPPTFATSSRSVTSSTGATGVLISASKEAIAGASFKITGTATVGTPSEGYISMEISPTNSSSAGDWVQVAVCGGGQTITLAAVLQSVQSSYCSVNAPVPTGYYVKYRSVTVSDTPTFTLLSSWEQVK